MSADESSKELSVPWTQCPTCNQDYTGTFAWRLAGNFSMQYDSYPYNELRRQVSIETLSRVFLETSQYDMGIGAMKKRNQFNPNNAQGTSYRWKDCFTFLAECR
jgi:hypothetical protein